MSSIVKATEHHAALLAEVGGKTFIESHGHSAPEQIVNAYKAEKFTEEAVRKELLDPANVYYIIYHNDKPAGYSKIILNATHPNISAPDVTKLERLYLLQEFLDQKLGARLLNFNIELSKQHQQSGMWLFVWMKNDRAFRFYQKAGFKIIGSHDFHLSPDHANPNHQMYLEY